MEAVPRAEVKRQSHHMGRVTEGLRTGPMYHGQLAKKTATASVGVCTPITYISRGQLGTSTLNETCLQNGLGTSPNLFRRI